MSLFCRHNRMTARCPICAREQEAELRSSLPERPARRRTGQKKPGSSTGRSSRATTGLRTRRLERAPDDGYRNALVPGLRATADARRLACTLGTAAERLAPPGPHPAVAECPGPEDAAWLAFLVALAGPDAPELAGALESAAPAWADGIPEDLPERMAETAAAYREWAGRAGSQVAALTGEPSWAPAQRFGRIFDRLAFRGFPRASRYEFLNTLGAAGVVAVEADALRPAGDEDPATVAAKRILLSGDRMLIERRARDLARSGGVPLGALDRAFADWERGGGQDGEPPEAIARALRID